jgi:large subunit ribosomal protein L3
MALGLLGTKVGMTQVFGENGEMVPVTILQLGPCPVVQVKTKKEGEDPGDGYFAVQLGFLDKPRRKAIRAERGHVAKDFVSKRKERRLKAGVVAAPKADCEPQRYLREFRLDGPTDLAVGTRLTVTDIFTDIAAVDVIATSKGRGTTGVIKRHNFGGLRHSHGVKKGSRQRGSIASNASNRGSGRPKKGIRMAGRYGNERVTIRNLKVIRIDADLNLMLVRGAIPGPNGGFIMVRPSNKLRKKK